MQSSLPTSTLADRFAGLSGEVGLAAEEAGRLKQLFLEMLNRLLVMLAGLAGRFAAGNLPTPTPQDTRSTPAARRHLDPKADARRPGLTWNRAGRTQDGSLAEISALGASALNQTVPGTLRAPRLVGTPRDDGQRHLALSLDFGSTQKTGIQTTSLPTSKSLR